MKVLHVTPTYFPATYWGGPIWSTKAICDGISGRNGVDLRVLTTDAAGPRLADQVTPEQLPYRVTYSRRVAGHSIAPGLIARLPAAMAWADVVHLTGVYNTPTLPVFLLAKVMRKPLVWSPRGALQATHEWAGAPKPRAKRAFGRLLNTLRPSCAVMHVTAAAEADARLHTFPDMPVATIPNAVSVPVAAPKVAAKDGTIRLIYLGRLHAKKGLTELITALHALPDRFSLDIYGTGTPEYVAELHKHAQGLGHRIIFHGHVDDAGKAAAFARADLFVLPSHSENFGIAIAEALAHGVPVLTTTATPWQALDAKGCGRCITLGHDDLGAAITDLAAQDLTAMGVIGRTWMRQAFSHDAMADAFFQLYRDLAQKTGEWVTA